MVTKMTVRRAENLELHGIVATRTSSRVSLPRMVPFTHRLGLIRWAGVTLAGTIFVVASGHSSNVSPTANSRNLKVVVAGEIGTFEWDFVVTGGHGAYGTDRRLRSIEVRRGQGSGQKCISKAANLTNRTFGRRPAFGADFQFGNGG